MALSVSYTHFNGRLLHENREGVESFYVPNQLGSTIALTDSVGNTTDTFSFWPCGEVRARTGINPTPFIFVGTFGYYTNAFGGIYVRARTFRSTLGRWLTRDPLWPNQDAYSYAGGSPVLETDPSGLMFGYGNYCGARSGPGAPINDVDTCCQVHDDCLKDWTCWVNPIKEKKCDCDLCTCVISHINSSCKWYDLKCKCGAIAVAEYACASCASNPLVGILVGFADFYGRFCYIFG